MKDYVCVGCSNNNNGWCKECKIQVNTMKNKTECAYRPNSPEPTSSIDFTKVLRETLGNNPNNKGIVFWTAEEQKAFFEAHPEIHTFMFQNSQFNLAVRSLTTGINIHGLVLMLYFSFKENTDLRLDLLSRIDEPAK